MRTRAIIHFTHAEGASDFAEVEYEGDPVCDENLSLSEFERIRANAGLPEGAVIRTVVVGENRFEIPSNYAVRMAIRPIESLAAVRLFAPALLRATPSGQSASVYVDVDEEAERTLPREIDRVVVREQVRALLPERLRADPERQRDVERLTDEVMNHIDLELRNPYHLTQDVLQNFRHVGRMYHQERVVVRGAAPYEMVVGAFDRPMRREVGERFRRERSRIMGNVAEAVSRLVHSNGELEASASAPAQAEGLYVDTADAAVLRVLSAQISREVVREQVRALLPQEWIMTFEGTRHAERLTDFVMARVRSNLEAADSGTSALLLHQQIYQQLYRREGTVLRGAAPYQIVADTLSLQVDVLLNRESAVPGRVGPLGRAVLDRLHSERSSILERVAEAVGEDRRLIPIFERLAENHPEIHEVCRIHPQFALDFLTRLEGIVREQGMDPEVVASQLWSEFEESMPRFERLEAEERGRVERERTDRTERIAEIFRRALEIGRETGRRR